ncbi:replication protein [Streptococcus uberis]
MASDLTKARNFGFVIYPESIPVDWKERLEKLGLPMAISPLHDKDKSDSEQGGFKKAHYHVIYIAKNPVTKESVRKKIKRALGNNSLNYMEIIDHIEGAFLYLTHESKDAIRKKKHIYNKKDIVYLNDFDIDRYITLDEHQKKDLKNRLLILIRNNHLVNLTDLIGFLEQQEIEKGVMKISDVFDIIGANNGIFRMMFDANYQNGFRATHVAKINVETGEILEN